MDLVKFLWHEEFPFNSIMLFKYIKFGMVAALIVILGYTRVMNGLKFLYQHMRSIII